MIKTGPDVPDARLEIIEKLASKSARRRFELPRLMIRTEYRRVGATLLLQPQQAPMLRIEIKEQSVLDAQQPWSGRAIDGKSQHLVGAIAVLVDKVIGRVCRTTVPVRRDFQPRQCIGGDFPMVGAQFTPGNQTV